MLKARLVILLLLAGVTGCPNPNTGGHSNVVGGAAEPDYKYPWVVSLNSGCRGVLIHPQWVLTAAHCIISPIGGNSVVYTRTDPYTGQLFQETRLPAQDGVILHEGQNQPAGNDDVALIRLQQAFSVNKYIQTVGIPSSTAEAGLVGTVASFSHTMTLPEGQVAVFRAQAPAIGTDESFLIGTTDSTGSLCPGDSGSGFVTLENGRATVRGVLSEASGDCVTAANHVVRFMNVFAYRDWIFENMRTTDYRLAGNTRVHWSGSGGRGSMILGCPNPYDTMTGPLNVAGVEEGANCEPGQTQSIVCSLSDIQAGTRTLAIKSFTMKTSCPGHFVTTENLPFSSTFAGYYGLMPQSPDPVGICFREFNCQIGLGDIYEPPNGGVFTNQ
jgi:secreted trypsin-like serine protease